MKKIILVLLVLFSFIPKRISAAPSWQIYVMLQNSEEYLKLVSTQAKLYAGEYIQTNPIPTSQQQILAYNFANDILISKWNSPIITKIASYITNATYLTNITDWQAIAEDIKNSFAGGCGTYTVFYCIAGIY